MTKCRGCIYLKVRPDANGKVRVRRQNAYPCGAPVPSLEDLKLPASVAVGNYHLKWPPHQWFMNPDEEHKVACPHFSSGPR